MIVVSRYSLYSQPQTHTHMHTRTHTHKHDLTHTYAHTYTHTHLHTHTHTHTHNSIRTNPPPFPHTHTGTTPPPDSSIDELDEDKQEKLKFVFFEFTLSGIIHFKSCTQWKIKGHLRGSRSVLQFNFIGHFIHIAQCTPGNLFLNLHSQVCKVAGVFCRGQFYRSCHICSRLQDGKEA